jgi:hypothetical protein
MGSKATIHVENKKTAAVSKLATRRSLLEEKGLEKTAIKRDPKLRSLEGEVRKCNKQLAAIAALEKLSAERAQQKAEKAAAPAQKKEKKAKSANQSQEGSKKKKQKKEKKS